MTDQRPRKSVAGVFAETDKDYQREEEIVSFLLIRSQQTVPNSCCVGPTPVCRVLQICLKNGALVTFPNNLNKCGCCAKCIKINQFGTLGYQFKKIQQLGCGKHIALPQLDMIETCM